MVTLLSIVCYYYFGTGGGRQHHATALTVSGWPSITKGGGQIETETLTN